MKCAKIVVKNDYEKRGDLVLRSYVRAMIKTKTPELLNVDNIENSVYLSGKFYAYIYGIIDDKNVFYELFTGNPIDYDGYYIIELEEFDKLLAIPQEKKDLIKKVIGNVLFKQENELSFEISNINELAIDRDIEFVAFDRCLSRINPYHRLGDNVTDKYNDFLYKLEEIKNMKRIDSIPYTKDEYEVMEYIPREEKKKIYKRK